MPEDASVHTPDTLLGLRPRICKLGGPVHREDLCQDVCVKLIRKEREGRAPIRDPRLVFHIARQADIDMRRRENRRSHDPLPDDECVSHEVDPSWDFEQRELLDRLSEALGKLDPNQSEAIKAHHILGETDQQTSLRLGVPIETLRTRRKAGSKKLKERLKDLNC